MNQQFDRAVFPPCVREPQLLNKKIGLSDAQVNKGAFLDNGLGRYPDEQQSTDTAEWQSKSWIRHHAHLNQAPVPLIMIFVWLLMG